MMPGNLPDRARNIGIRTRDGREIFSEKYFYHCVLAFEHGLSNAPYEEHEHGPNDIVGVVMAVWKLLT
jgi:hypothetical protein